MSLRYFYNYKCISQVIGLMEFCKQNYKFDITVKTRLDYLLYYLIRGVSELLSYHARQVYVKLNGLSDRSAT